MTLQQAYELLLKRVGLDESNTTFKDQARIYLNIAAKELGGVAKWWWQYKQGTLTTTSTLTLTGSISSGPFVAGEVIEGGSSGRTATVAASYDATNASASLFYRGPSTTTDFTTGETITGATSGANAAAGADVVTREYQLASDVLMHYSWRDETNNRLVTIASWDEMDRADPDQNESGEGRWIIPEGIDSNTGYHIVALFPLHSTSNETFKYRYYSYITDWTSANDTTSLDGWIPQVLQPAIVYAGASLYQQEKGDEDGARVNRQEYDRQVDRALMLNQNIFGNRRRSRSEASTPVGFDFTVSEGSLS